MKPTEEIPLARLEAVPYATMTVRAQQKLEKKADDDRASSFTSFSAAALCFLIN